MDKIFKLIPMARGSRTLGFNYVVLVGAVATFFGVDVPEADAAAIVAGFQALAGIWFRYRTSGPVAKQASNR